MDVEDYINDLDYMKRKVSEEYPKIGKFMKDTDIIWSDKASNIPGGVLEFYPKGESWSPNPSRHVIELYDKNLAGGELKKAIAGDMLHLLGDKDYETGEPYDPEFYKLKTDFMKTFTPWQVDLDKKVYAASKIKLNETRSFEDWMWTTRGDAWIRSGLFPDRNDYWRGSHTIEQQLLLDKMKDYLKSQ